MFITGQREWDFSPLIKTDYDLQFKEFCKQPPKSSFKKLILGTVILKGLKRMSDKSCPKGLKAFKVERGHTRAPPIPYIPVEDDVAEAVTKNFQGFGVQVGTSKWDQGLTLPMGKRECGSVL